MTERERFLRFLAAGGTAALANAASRWLFSLAMPFELAIPLAYVVGMALAFGLMRGFVFRAAETGGASGQFGRFALVNAWSFAQVWLVSVGLARLVFPWLGLVWQAETIAHLIGLGTSALTSYLAHRWFSFGQRAVAGS
jgi:putative flippase GtrA